MKMKNILIPIAAAVLVLVLVNYKAEAEPNSESKIPSPMYRAISSLIVDHLYDSLTGNRFQREGTRAMQEFSMTLTPDDLVVNPFNKQSVRLIWDNLIDSVNVAFAETPIKKEIRLFIRALIKSISVTDITNIFTAGSVTNFFLKAHAAVEETFGDNQLKSEFATMLKLEEESIQSLQDTLKAMLKIRVPPPILPKEEL